MTGMLSSKRGVSPLIATIILIAFAVALGVVVINIGRNTFGAAGFTVKGNQACFGVVDGQSVILIDVENGNTMEIKDFLVKIYGSNEIVNVPNTLTTPLAQSYGTRLKIPYDPAALGNIKSISLNSVIVRNGMDSNEPAVEITNIVPCQ
jgi:flagellin-like protein